MKKMTLLTGLVAAVVATAYSVSGTYARYTSTFEGASTARVAKWAFSINENDVTANNNFTFDLFKTINDTDGKDETDVAKGNGENIIAPGTQGEFEIVLANASEVNAKYSINYTVGNINNIPVEFSLDGNTWVSDMTQLNVTDEDINMNGGEATINVYWKWTFERGTEEADKEANNTFDTTLGIDGTATITVTATITATQVD